jgi:hypothetical protein
MSEAGNPRFACGQELLAGEFRRGVEVERSARSIGPERLRGEGMEMRLVAGRDLQGSRIHLHELAPGEEASQRRLNPVARQQERAAVGMDMRRPPGRGGGRGVFHSNNVP